ncbi:MAG: YitT family protein [Dorea sp.]
MLVVGFIFLGKKFAFTTIVSTFTYPICLELFGQIFANVHFTDDIWLNTIFSGAGNRSGAWKRHSYGSIHRRYGYSAVDFE